MADDEMEKQEPGQDGDTPIVMRPVSSSRVRALGHDGGTTLRAEFPNGRVAEYDGVPVEVFEQIMSSPSSIGGAFGDLIVNGGYSFHYL